MTEVIYPPCKYCGAAHGMGVKEMSTGKIEPMNICYKCLWKPLLVNPVIDPIALKDHINGYKELLAYTENKSIGDINNG